MTYQTKLDNLPNFDFTNEIPADIPPEIVLLNEEQVSNLLGISLATLRKWRRERTANSPVFVKMGHRVGYSIADLKTFALSNRVGGASHV